MSPELKKQITAAALELRRQGKTWDEMYSILETKLSIPNLRDQVKIQSSGRYTKDGVQKPKASNRQAIRVKKNRNEAKRSSVLKSLSDEEIIDFGRRNGYSSEDIRRAIARERRAKAAQNKYAKQMGLEIDHDAAQASGLYPDRWDAVNPGDASQGRTPMDPDENRAKGAKKYKGDTSRSGAIASLFDFNTPLRGEQLPTYKPPKTKPKPKSKSLLRSPSGTISGNKNLRRLGIAGKVIAPLAIGSAFLEGGAANAAVTAVETLTPAGDIVADNTAPGTLAAEQRRAAQVKAERDANLARKNRVTPQKKQQQLRQSQPANPALQKAKNAITSALGWLMPD